VIRLAHFVEQGAAVGGVERYLGALLAAAPEGLDHQIVLHSGAACDFAGRWPVRTLPWCAGAAGPPRPATDLAATLAGLDAVCLFHFPPSVEILAAARRAGAPVALFCHDHRWWCASGSRYHRHLRRACAIRPSSVACALRYHAFGCGGLHPAPLVRGMARASAGRAALATADAVLAASSFMAAGAARYAASPTRVHLVPLPAPGAELPAAAPPTTAPPVILFASRLSPEKGADVLLRAFARMRESVWLELAGAGIVADATARAVAAHPRAERIRLLGHLDANAMAEAYSRAAVVVLPSVWPEPFGLVGVEGLASGKPVVATRVGGTADWAREELGVLSVPAGDAPALAAALDRIVTEPVWTRRAREAGAPWVRAHHSLAAHTAALLEALGPLGARRPRA